MTRDYYREIFIKRLKELRLERGLTIGEFANKVGFSKSSVGYYESQNRVPDIIVAGETADVLDVSADYLIGGNNART
ncbi:MAG: helix-turn-helix domain-containing protein [Oscillospiraceae bacterium]|nr:helix-turn-helix domain-containing protein [Oscillospiraceae bacterium]